MVTMRIGLLCLTALSAAAAHGDSSAQAEIRLALTQWTHDFNSGNAGRYAGCSPLT